MQMRLFHVWNSFCWNFMGYHKNVPYFILLVWEPLKSLPVSEQSYFQQPFNISHFSLSRGTFTCTVQAAILHHSLTLMNIYVFVTQI